MATDAQDPVSTTVRALQRDWPVDVELGVSNLVPRDEAALCLYSAFDKFNTSVLGQFAVAMRLLTTSLSAMKRLTEDDSTTWSALLTASTIASQLEAHRQLQSLFPPEAAFWGRFRASIVAYTDARLFTWRYRTGRLPHDQCTEAMLLNALRDRGAISRVIVSGLSELAHGEHLYPSMLASVEHRQLAIGLIGDARQWRKAIGSNEPNFVLYRMRQAVSALHGDHLTVLRDASTDPALVPELIEYVLSLSLHAIDSAADALSDLHIPRWNAHLSAIRHTAEGMLHAKDATADSQDKQRLPSTLAARRHRMQVVLVDDVDAALRRLSELGHSILEPHCSAIKNSILRLATARRWTVVRYEDFVAWSQSVLPSREELLVLDPLHPAATRAATQLRPSRVLGPWGLELANCSQATNSSRIASACVSVVDDVASTGDTLVDIGRHVQAAGGQVSGFVLCCASEMAQHRIARTFPLSTSALYVTGDCHAVHLRDACPCLPFSGRPELGRRYVPTASGKVEVRIPTFATGGGPWETIRRAADVRHTLDQALRGIVRDLAAVVGRDPLVSDVPTLGHLACAPTHPDSRTHAYSAISEVLARAYS